MFGKGFFQNIEKKTGVKMTDVLKLANSFQNANFKDEHTVRRIVQEVSTVANKKVSKEMEEKIVQTLLNDSNSVNFDTVTKMLNQKK
ncbi:stage VI sporulation protein F [Alkalihalobacillus deserti]|uniref:stage VI sporulation protein F n=1 Tax=Alkalihalobacillus deserti TaxID=2879466 RepID=UPI001D13D218|nr:stage VI sporulation protein F [Alkalihalobacillus deserti]